MTITEALKEEIAREIERKMDYMSDGRPSDYSAYMKIVGQVEALRGVIKEIIDLEKNIEEGA